MAYDFSDFTFKSEFWTLTLPIILMCIDFFTGFLNAWIRKSIKSCVMRQGLGKKAGECCVILIGLLITKGMSAPIYLLGFFSFYIGLMELVSISENLDKLGVPLPKWLKKALGVLKDTLNNKSPMKGDETDGTEDFNGDDSRGRS